MQRHNCRRLRVAERSDGRRAHWHNHIHGVKCGAHAHNHKSKEKNNSQKPSVLQINERFALACVNNLQIHYYYYVRVRDTRQVGMQAGRQAVWLWLECYLLAICFYVDYLYRVCSVSTVQTSVSVHDERDRIFIWRIQFKIVQNPHTTSSFQFELRRTPYIQCAYSIDHHGIMNHDFSWSARTPAFANLQRSHAVMYINGSSVFCFCFSYRKISSLHIFFTWFAVLTSLPPNPSNLFFPSNPMWCDADDGGQLNLEMFSITVVRSQNVYTSLSNDNGRYFQLFLNWKKCAAELYWDIV